MSALEQQFKQWLTAQLTTERMEQLVRESAAAGARDTLMAGESLVKLKAVPAILGESSLKRAVQALATMGVAVRFLKPTRDGAIPRRRYVLRSELDAALRAMPALPTVAPHQKQDFSTKQ